MAGWSIGEHRGVPRTLEEYAGARALAHLRVRRSCGGDVSCAVVVEALVPAG